ncbi:putative late blight resistance protein -like r1c-3 [Nicotiana attenuata]|uniref:Late blight resistance protein -like r1c-3 n=1 Tax=Nicotiana attenuata TaxID=49451 RepID=A0A1J6IIS2_NICAT|nr:putative late blight resistance protein -like r1c-3 [Nicotiana attenuata]
MDEIEKLALELTVISACLQLCYFNSDGFEAEICSISYEVHDLVQPLFDHQSGDDMLVKLKNHFVPCVLQNIKSFISSPSHHHPQSIATITEDQLVELLDTLLVNLHCLYKCRSELIFPSMTLYELLQTVCGNLRDFHGLKINGCIERKTIEDLLAQFLLVVERVGHFCFVLLADQLDVPQVNSMLAHLLVKITPVELEVMHICSTNLKASKSAEVGRFIKKHMEASPIILREYLIHLHEHMVDVISASTSARNIHVVIEFLLIILTDVPEDFIHHDELFVLLEHVGALTREVSILVCSLEESSRNGENMNTTRNASLNLLENIELLKGDLKYVFLKGPVDLSQLYFPMSDGPLFMSLLLRNLNDLLNSNAYSVALIKEEIGLVKENLEFIRSFFGNDEQELNRDLWDRVLDLAYKVELTMKSILVRDHGLVHLIFLLPDIVEKINLIKEEVQEKICKNKGLVANSPNKHVESKSSTRLIGQIIVGFEEETDWMIRKLTSGPAEIDVISIIGMPGLGKTTLAYKVYNDKLVVDHFDVRAWCTVDHELNVNKLLQKIFNQVIGLTERINEDDIDDDIADKLRKKLFGRRYLIVLDDLSDTATWDELTMPFPQVEKGSRVILTSRVKEVALHGKRHCDPLNLRFLRPEESWELLEKRIFGEEHCPYELLDVGKEIAQRCRGLPLVLDMIGAIIARKEKVKVLWLEVLNNLDSFTFKDKEEEDNMVIQLSYDHLPDHLKPCLLYLASYPKDTYFRISELTDLWSAQGVVEQTVMKSAEEVTKVYLDELISSSLVIAFNVTGMDPSFQIHDLVHDFCLEKARKEKLFEFISSSAPSSSSDLMPRGMIIHYDQHDLHHSNKNFCLFNSEKENPHVKHLLSLKVNGKQSDLSNNGHLKHLRLL